MNIELRGVRPATRLEKEEAERIVKAKSSQLVTIRAAAEKWRNGSAISAALLAVGGVLGTGEALFSATVEARLAIGLALGLAATLTLVSLGLSMRASIGWPIKLKILTTDALSNWERKETSKAVRLLKWSMWIGLAAAVLLCAAVAILYFGPRDSGGTIEIKIKR